jgi:hypothetical protein
MPTTRTSARSPGKIAVETHRTTTPSTGVLGKAKPAWQEEEDASPRPRVSLRVRSRELASPAPPATRRTSTKSAPTHTGVVADTSPVRLNRQMMQPEGDSSGTTRRASVRTPVGHRSAAAAADRPVAPSESSASTKVKSKNVPKRGRNSDTTISEDSGASKVCQPLASLPPPTYLYPSSP